jgi:hypothetical protein
MGLMKKLFAKGGGESRPVGSTQFANSDPPSAEEKAKSLNSARRDLVREVLRETMGRHGIPSDWLDYRALSALTREQKSGMHVQILVRKADQQLLPYVHAFQQSFREQLLRIDATAREWLFSLGWEFHGEAVQGFSPMPHPESWSSNSRSHGDTQPPNDDDVASDLEALHALMSGPTRLGDLPEAEPREHKKTG